MATNRQQRTSMTTDTTIDATDATVPTRDCCDICKERVDRREDTPDRMIAANFGNDEEDLSLSQTIDAIAAAIEDSGAIHDERLAHALRAKHGWFVHERCLDDTSLHFEEDWDDDQ